MVAHHSALLPNTTFLRFGMPSSKRASILTSATTKAPPHFNPPEAQHALIQTRVDNQVDKDITTAPHDAATNCKPEHCLGLKTYGYQPEQQ